VSVQYPVGRYRIDIVVAGPRSRLAVECDGDRWHGPDIWHKDRAGQQVLERANWTFERIRASAFYRDPDAALLPLWQRLTVLGIPTGDWWPTGTAQQVVREVSGAGG
jgi:very-short-patch-repair endonuclease